MRRRVSRSLCVSSPPKTGPIRSSPVRGSRSRSNSRFRLFHTTPTTFHFQNACHPAHRMGHIISTYRDPSSMPDITIGPIFDQHQGFAGERKKRVSKVTEEEMIAAGLKPHERDYCAHTLIAFKKCKAENALGAFVCSHLRHMNLQCHLNDQLLRRKEYERERRLLAKQRAHS
ncbi:unnamed protein product [Dicrocoelium dendriticum]|nr:unnamed protein product [Dicrocoelium dendriticum]